MAIFIIDPRSTDEWDDDDYSITIRSAFREFFDSNYEFERSFPDIFVAEYGETMPDALVLDADRILDGFGAHDLFTGFARHILSTHGWLTLEEPIFDCEHSLYDAVANALGYARSRDLSRCDLGVLDGRWPATVLRGLLRAAHTVLTEIEDRHLGPSELDVVRDILSDLSPANIVALELLNQVARNRDWGVLCSLPDDASTLSFELALRYRSTRMLANAVDEAVRERGWWSDETRSYISFFADLDLNDLVARRDLLDALEVDLESVAPLAQRHRD